MVQVNLSQQVEQEEALPSSDSGLDIDNEFVCPLTGEVVEYSDIDGMIDTYERLKAKSDQMYACMISIREQLASKTVGDAVTRRVQGKRRRVKVESPDVKFEQSILKELMNSHPHIAKDYLRVAQVNVLMTAYNKLVNTASSEPDYTFFRDTLTKACNGRVGTPTIKIEV